jgi:hypothetical protein
MEKFSAEKFFAMGQVLGSLEQLFKPGRQFKGGREGLIVYFNAWLQNIEDHGRELGLRQSEKCAQRIHKKVNKSTSDDDLDSWIRQITELIHSEMEEHLFLWIPPSRISFYSQTSPLFGESVVANFPSALKDISEAGKCFAAGRNTACVLHLMRVLEIGLASLSKAMTVPYTESSWQGILTRLESRWKKIEMRRRKPSGWKRDRQFFNEAFTEFRHLKDAWRNHAMHARAQYDEERAETVLLHVKSFMQHLATRLREDRGEEVLKGSV